METVTILWMLWWIFWFGGDPGLPLINWTKVCLGSFGFRDTHPVMSDDPWIEGVPSLPIDFDFGISMTDGSTEFNLVYSSVSLFQLCLI